MREQIEDICREASSVTPIGTRTAKSPVNTAGNWCQNLFNSRNVIINV